MSPLEFWELTPHEFNYVIQGFCERQKSDRKERISIAYVQAQWTAQWAMSKTKPKPLKKIFDDMDRVKKDMTPNEMLDKVKQLNMIFGGEIKVEK